MFLSHCKLNVNYFCYLYVVVFSVLHVEEREEEREMKLGKNTHTHTHTHVIVQLNNPSTLTTRFSYQTNTESSMYFRLFLLISSTKHDPNLIFALSVAYSVVTCVYSVQGVFKVNPSII